jgi:YidC/Oxa1 family membrane protein insertase
MERRLLLALALSFLVIMLTRPYWEPQRPPVPSPEHKRVDQEHVVSKPEVQVVPQTESISAEVAMKGEAEKQILLETDLYQLTLSSKEAVVHSWLLKKYKDNNAKLLDVIDARKTLLFGYPLSLRVDKEDDLSKQLKNMIFIVDSPDRVDLTGPVVRSKSITFDYGDERLRVMKKLTFFSASYAINVECRVWVQGKPSSYYLNWNSGFGDSTVDERMAIRRAVYRTEGKVKRIKDGDVGAGQEFSGVFDYAGIEDTYFTAMFLPRSDEVLHRVRFAVDEHVLNEGKKEKLLSASIFANPTDSQEVRLFVGPKDTEVLKQAGQHLTEVIDYGWFRVVCEPLFLGLKWIHSFVRNYGVAIIILTILINLALFPLKYKSIVSAAKMQKLQPQMKAIQEKYKKLKPTDPKRQQMNSEVMALYKEHGVNPLGGCLPLLLQMPFFIAFYNLLSVAIELRHAPFFFWIKDLSAADHTYILPILMTLSMVAMQKMTPMPSADPVQAKMMMAMPIFFGFMLAFTSSGLVLYWLTSNVVGIGQQYFLNKFGPNASANISQKKSKKSYLKKSYSDEGR